MTQVRETRILSALYCWGMCFEFLTCVYKHSLFARLCDKVVDNNLYNGMRYTFHQFGSFKPRLVCRESCLFHPCDFGLVLLSNCRRNRKRDKLFTVHFQSFYLDGSCIVPFNVHEKDVSGPLIAILGLWCNGSGNPQGKIL